MSAKAFFAESPISAAYGFVTHLRNIAYDQKWLSSYKSSLPVICVGNLTVGGNGKTPLVLWLATQLLARAHRPVILSRGYGGRHPGPRLIAGDADRAVDVGDEPLMMARRRICPVVIARRRVAGAKMIESQKLGDVIILDDGLQHRALERDINLLCVAAATESQVEKFLFGAMLPRGLQREPLSDALARTDAIIWQSRNPQPACPVPDDPRIRDLQIFRTTCEGRVPAGIDECVVVTAIANPEQVIASLPEIKVLKHYALSDHNFSLDRALAKARAEFAGKMIVITEKDAVKLNGLVGDVVVLTQELHVDNGATLLESCIARIDICKALGAVRKRHQFELRMG